MAVASSVATTLSLLPLHQASFYASAKSSFLSFSLLSPNLSLRLSRASSPRLYAAPDDFDQFDLEEGADEEDDSEITQYADNFDSIIDDDGVDVDEGGGDEIPKDKSNFIDIEDKREVTTKSPPRKRSSSSAKRGGKLLFGADSYPSNKRPLTRLHASLKDSPSTYPEKIILKNNSGENLSGILQDAGSNELVILCHGFRSSKESKTIFHLADALASKGISSFRFDFSGNGESEGNFEYGNYYKEVEDLRTVVRFFREQNRDVTAILGHSKGGNVVILYALKYKDVYSVVNLAGRFDLKGGIKERLGEDYIERIRKDGFLDVKDKLGKVYRVTEASLIERIGIDMQAACVSLDKNCRVLTVHGSKDSTVPPSDAMEFSKLIRNHRLEIIEGADHRFSAHLFNLSDIVVEFVRLGLKDASMSC